MSRWWLALAACFACVVWAEEGTPDNPRPLADDVSLPLPCGGEMVFRYVYVLTKGSLDDREINLGYPFGEDEPGYQQSFMSGFRRDYISGQFSLNDLPGDWRSRIAPRLPSYDRKMPLQPMLYFIGKYEVSAAQYAKVMSQASLLEGGNGGECPADAGGQGRLPKVRLSRFEAERFAAIYSAWLLQNQRKALPISGRALRPNEGGLAHVRLPTEAEWEFAARGGHAVSRQELEARLFPRPQPGGEGDGPLGEWAVYNQVSGGTGQQARLLPIGSRKPNPIGLHDVIGNAAEMVNESFQLVRAGRRHGSYGGFVVKGGNYLEGEMTLFTGMRREYPLFAADGGEQRNETTGMRIALGAIAAPRSRYQDLFEQWQADGRLAGLTDEIDEFQDPTKRLDEIIAASKDQKLQAQLAQVNEDLKRDVALIARQREEAAGNLIQSAALVAETINNYNIRLTNLKNSRDQALAARDQASADLFAGAIANGQSAVDGAVAIYIDNLATGTRYTDAVIQEQFQRVMEELNRQPVLGKSLAARATVFVGHVGQYRKQQRADPALILKEVLASGGR